MFSKIKYFLIFVFFILMFSSLSYSVEQPQINITFDESVEQFVRYNPLEDTSSNYNSDWVDENENQSYYNITGKLVIENVNEEWTDATLGNIQIEIDNADEILWFDRIRDSRNATISGFDGEEVNESINESNFFDNVYYNQSELLIRIPELVPGDNVSFNYSINPETIRPPINFTSSYNRSKIISGDSFEVNDVVENVFDHNDYQRDCIYDINIIQEAIYYDDYVDGSDMWFNFTFLNDNVDADASDVASINADLTTLEWDVNDGDCLYFGETSDITYDVLSPETIPSTDNYDFLNTSISYNINSTLSNVNVIDVKARSEKVDFNLSKRIDGVANETAFPDRNVTWEVGSNVYTELENISYNVTEVSLWVSEAGGDPNVIDTDHISGEDLNMTYNWDYKQFNDLIDPDCSIDDILYLNNPVSNDDCEWYFNYSDLPSPIVWNSFDYHLNVNDYYLFNETGDSSVAQIQSHSLTTDEDDRFVKQMYIIVDYWLELEKNITSLGNDTYKIEVWVHNRGNRWTPENAPVSIFDYVPGDFDVITDMTDYDNESIYSDSLTDVYSTDHESHDVSGEQYDGQMFKWSLLYEDDVYEINSSLAPGYDTGWDDFNSTWYTKYVVQGDGDYEATDLYIVGLDPELVDGAASDLLIEIKGGIKSLGSEEMSFLIAFMFSVSIMFMVIFKN